jgi:hypothetical protein
MTTGREDREDFAGTRGAGHARWEPAEVTSPHLDRPVPVIAAKDIPYIPNNNRLQNVSIYLPLTPRTAELIGAPVRSLPGADSPSGLPRYLVHVHGGAWRDPRLTSASIEPAVSCAFAGEEPAPVSAIATICPPFSTTCANTEGENPKSAWRRSSAVVCTASGSFSYSASLRIQSRIPSSSPRRARRRTAPPLSDLCSSTGAILSAAR